MAQAGPDPTRQRPEPYFSSAYGAVYYSPRTGADRRRRHIAAASFPTPPIQARQRRPHSIHIVSYPAGFIPYDLRPEALPHPHKAAAKKKKRKEKNLKQARKAERNSEKRKSILSIGDTQNKVLGKLIAAFSTTPKPPSIAGTLPPTPRPTSRRSSFASFARRLSRLDFDSLVFDEPRARSPNMVDATRPSSLVLPAAHGSNRNSFMSMRSSKQALGSVIEVQRPVASGSGVACSILMAESNVFLTGFDHDGHTRHESQNSTALLRGRLQLNVSKNVKIKCITLKLVGKARTEWPEGIPPLKVDMFEEETLRTQSLVFFHAMHEGIWETEYGNQCRFTLKGTGIPQNMAASASPNNSNPSLHILNNRARQPNALTAKELKRLSLQSVNSRSFGKGESPLANQVQAKGYKVFYPGTYEYTFELPIDHHQLETTKLQYGSVKWELETTVERAGAFKTNLHGTKEVTIVRVPDQMSLEMTEPISISRQWEDQLHYDIMISGKSFPLGTKIPIAFKLTPLAKVQVHKLKVFVTEAIEYWTNDRRVTRKDPGRKILLLEKAAGRPLDKQYETSDVRVISGGELGPQEREEARRAATTRRSVEARRLHGVPEPLPEPSDNILGDLDLGLEHYWGSTEIEMNVQMPTCEMMARDKTLRLHPDCSWKNVNVYHWIKIVMRISRLDPEDPTGQRRRHFEISIDSPFTVLDCRATQANTALPQYSGPDGASRASRKQCSTCGCPDSGPVSGSPSSSSGQLPLVEQENVSPNGNPSLDRVNSAVLPAAPQAAHVQASPTWPAGNPSRQSGAPSSRNSRLRHEESASGGPSMSARTPSPDTEPRPIHLLRVPSYNPPAFDAEDPPPSLPWDIMTPPPNYDLIVGTPSVDGLADYFARLKDYEDPHTDAVAAVGEPGGPAILDGGVSTPSMSGAIGTSEDFFSGRTTGHEDGEEEDSDSDESEDPARPHQRGRVNVANPRTPGGRLIPSRSLDLERPVMQLSMAGVVRRGE